MASTELGDAFHLPVLILLNTGCAWFEVVNPELSPDSCATGVDYVSLEFLDCAGQHKFFWLSIRLFAG